MVKKADKIIAVSQSTKKDLEEILHVPAEKIKVIYNGLDRRFYDEPPLEAKKILAKYGISKKYILFLGTLEPLKNVSRLLEAFALFKENYKKQNKKFDWQLVLAGKRGWLSQQYPQLAKDLGVSKDIVFTGYIIGDELVPLFKNAEFFILPSLWEGFGTTALEAFATGTPAIVSRVSSLPEIASDATYYVNPVSKEEIADAMLKFATDENLRSEFREKGLEQVKKFDWETTARQTLDIYKSLMQ